ncbi:hypothetical protein ABTZ57_01285 [Streptomyces sp. NPDC094048]|uniref:hypothetical protein n=1 Tax=unclassified Streptomyces TaxID=2593676 RepID=UPI00332096DD
MSEMSEARFTEIKAMTFTTGLNAFAGHFDTDVEREHYVLAARCWNAMQELIRDREHLVQAHAATAEELATWTGSLAT